MAYNSFQYWSREDYQAIPNRTHRNYSPPKNPVVIRFVFWHNQKDNCYDKQSVPLCLDQMLNARGKGVKNLNTIRGGELQDLVVTCVKYFRFITKITNWDSTGNIINFSVSPCCMSCGHTESVKLYIVKELTAIAHSSHTRKLEIPKFQLTQHTTFTLTI